MIDVSPYKFNSSGGTGCPTTTHVTHAPDIFRGKYRVDNEALSSHDDAMRSSCTQQYLDDFENLLQDLADREIEPAAMIAEPLLGCGGQIVPPTGYLSGVFQRVQRLGGVCIADEVQIGFGRVGEKFWGFELDEAMPDIVTMGKPIANGHPMGAVVTTREIADAFNNGMEYFNTFGGNPVSCAAGLAVLDFVKQHNLTEHAQFLGTFLLAQLQIIAADSPSIGHVRGKGLFCGIEFVVPESDRIPDSRAARFIVDQLREEQILLSTDGPDNNVIKIKPPLVISQHEIEYFLRRFKQAVQELPML